MKRLFPILLLSAALPLSAATFQQASQDAETRLNQALSEFARIQQQIEQEKIPLGTELGELEQRVLRLREQAAEQRRITDNSQFDLNSLEARVNSKQDNASYMASLLGDYIRRFETTIHIAEKQRYEDTIDAAKEAMENPELEDSAKFRAQLAVVSSSLDRANRVIGGAVFGGSATIDGGSYEQGRFVLLGPVAYFASEETSVAGEAIEQINAASAQVIPVDAGDAEGIRQVVNTNSGTLPVDTTLGDAYKVSLTEETALEQIAKGGMVMYPMLTLAFIAFLIAAYKFFEISTVRKAKEADVGRILESIRNGDVDNAMAQARTIKGPAGEILQQAVANVHQDKEVIEEVLYEVIIKTQPKLERMLPFIAVTAATAPLLGLLGTVTGMIKTFKLITVFGAGDAQSLSSGISEALITTQYGLIIAIPTLIAHALLSRKAKGVIASLEQTAVTYINGLVEIREGMEEEMPSLPDEEA